MNPATTDKYSQQNVAKMSKRAIFTSRMSRLTVWLLLVLGSIAFIAPMYVMLVIALKSPNEFATTDIWAWPKAASFANFKEVLADPTISFVTLFHNSLVIATYSTVGVVLSSAFVAYPFARMKFRGRNRLFTVLLSTMMLPGIVTMIPTYVLFKYLHWIDTFYPLWVPAWLGGGAFNIFLLRQFFMGIPKELDEAAWIDGASYARIFWQIIMPNSRAALATVGILSFIYNWRDFLGPLLYLNDPQKQTLEVGLNTYKALNASQWHLLMAASVLVMIPLIVIFLFGQKYFMKGIVMSEGK